MDSSRNEPPEPAVKRLSLYLRLLQEFHRDGMQTISSKQLGQRLGLTDAQVRKDFAYFGQFGHPGVGYRVDEMIERLRHILGTDKTWNVLLIGAGNLGRALLSYRGFESKGFHVAAVFDVDPATIGRQFGNLIVQSLDGLEETVKRQQIRLAMLAVPSDAAQEAADRLIAAGVRGLLNFAPVSIIVPDSVSLTAVDLAVQLEQLSFQVGLPQPDRSTR